MIFARVDDISIGYGDHLSVSALTQFGTVWTSLAKSLQILLSYLLAPGLRKILHVWELWKLNFVVISLVKLCHKCPGRFSGTCVIRIPLLEIVVWNCSEIVWWSWWKCSILPLVLGFRYPGIWWYFDPLFPGRFFPRIFEPESFSLWILRDRLLSGTNFRGFLESEILRIILGD